MPKKTSLVLGLLAIVLILALGIPFVKSDSIALESHEITCAKNQSKTLFSTVENLIILDFVVQADIINNSDIVYATTFFGATYGRVVGTCDTGFARI
ncbi:MAG: hypothetical protein ACD_28C00151G0010 [uncultured bacterium]|nr:MAG: hypothetical protein ACD_28C00151G0010 [uncultured bacterium]KKT74754.1 MAG: hypothetical protein UW70_C0046G0012 [Candidatus Peregrinibacteria bacterium GW2011_GWA2_44_7]